ncbi:MAG: hypothetical protein LBK61_01645 [Spirochaetaceae bacterium]|jgi:hypothetical protein|nr:hypothetical protein [Spirochaetaceae bacterium]
MNVKRSKVIGFFCVLLVFLLIVGGGIGCDTNTEETPATGADDTAWLSADLALNFTGSYGVAHPNAVATTNYIVLEVKEGNYTKGVYKLNDAAVTPSPVLTESIRTTLVKLAVPAGIKAVSLTVTENGKAVLEETSVTFETASTAAPEVLYGKTAMAFSEFFHDVTANIAEVRPSVTSFAKNGSVAVPELFITAGTRTGNNSAGTANMSPKWTDTDAQAKVDAISSATYGDNPHFVPTGNLAVNYADVQTKADDHRITGIKAVQVGVAFDLLANAVILNQTGKTVATSAAVLAKVGGIDWIAQTAIYKAKYLRPDASWGKRDDTALNSTATVAAAWPKAIGGANGATVSVSYGGTWADKVIAVDFAPLTGGLTSATLWTDYFEKVYAGYVEDLQTRHKEPLVWLQNLFSHQGHTNLEAAINRSTAGISRMNRLSDSGDMKVVIFAVGMADIILERVGVVKDAASAPTIEQGSVFHVSGTGATADFKDNAGVTVPGKQLHVGNLSTAALVDFTAKQGVIQKGGADIPTTAYTLEKEGDGEIAITLTDTFFSGAFQGAYTLKINSDTTVHPTTSFTVNRIIARPKVKQGDGAAADAATEAAALTVSTGSGNIVFDNTDFAKAVITTGRAVSSIAPSASPSTPVAGAIKKDSDDTYYVDASLLTTAVDYTLTVLTSNFVDATRTSLGTVTYYIKVQ